MLSDIENLDIMLGENHFGMRESDGSLNSSLPRGPRSSVSNESENEDGNIGRNQRNINSRTNTECDRNSVTGNSSAEINRLSSELNSCISREMDEMMNSVNVQIQRAISDAISTQVLPQIQNVIMAGSGHGTKKGWDVPSERPELIPEVQRNLNAKNNLRNEQDENQVNNDYPELNVHDMVTGDNESPNQVPEFLTGRIPSRSHLNQSYEDINLDTTIPAHERIATAADPDPITRLAGVLTTMQNRPTAQQLTIRPVNSNTKTFDGKSEKFELFEDLFHTMIQMQPEMTEQMKINHFHSLLRKNALQTFRNINSTNRQTLEDVLVIFRQKYVKPESQATAKHKWHRLVFDPNTMKLPYFLEELNQGAEKAFGDHAQKMIDSLLYAKLPPKLKKSVNMARLENGSYDEIVAHLERELELNALEESDDLPMATMTSSSAKPKTPLTTGQMSDITCNYCKEKATWLRTVKSLRRKKRKMPNKANRLKRKHIRSVAPVAKRITRRKDVGKVPVRTLNPSALDPRTQMITSLIQMPKNLRPNRHHQTLNPHLPMMSQKTNFATTPIQRTSIRPPIHQVGPSNQNFSPIQSAIVGLPLCCLAATDGQSHHHHEQQYPSIPKTNSCLGP